jgi:hypothetical protein
MNMEKNNLNQAFAERLKTSMIAAGYHSKRSTSGVDIHALADIMGYSTQICRKYLRGEAIPDPVKLLDLSKKLLVSPGWLLFGDSFAGETYSNKSIVISKNMLHYIFLQVAELYHVADCQEDVSDFLVDLTRDISQIDADEAQLKKIVDLAFSSVKHFRA